MTYGQIYTVPIQEMNRNKRLRIPSNKKKNKWRNNTAGMFSWNVQSGTGRAEEMISEMQDQCYI